jgi:phytoene desaturase
VKRRSNCQASSRLDGRTYGEQPASSCDRWRLRRHRRRPPPAPEGHQVTLLERNSALGGRGRVWQHEGFTFDAGPTVLTAPVLFEELFQLFGERMADHVKLLPVAPWYQYRFHDGTHLNYGPSMEQTIAEVQRISPDDVAGYRKLLKYSEALFQKAYVELADQSFQSHTRLLRELPAFLRLGGHRSVYSQVANHLKDDRLRRAFSVQPLLVGGNPYNTTAIYLLIHFLESKWGVWFPKGGMGSMVTALEGLMIRTGITVRTSVSVAEITTDGAKTTGVRLESGEVLAADLVVANADPAHVYDRMLPSLNRHKWHTKKLAGMNYSMGLFVLYFATKRRYPEVVHHTIAIGQDYKGTLDDIFYDGRITDDFSYYLHRPSATDPEIAPDGKDTFYVLVPVPNLRHPIDWKTQGPELATRLLNRLEKDLLPGLKDELITHFHITPEYFRNELLSVHGAGFSIQPTLTQSASFRFRNQSEEINNLFFVGAGTHPGAGVPGVLCSAKVTASLVEDWVAAA